MPRTESWATRLESRLDEQDRRIEELEGAESEEEEDGGEESDDLSYDENDDDIEVAALRGISTESGIPTRDLYRMWTSQGGTCFLSGVPLAGSECAWYAPVLVPYVVEVPLGRKNFRIAARVAAGLRPEGMRWSQLVSLCSLVHSHAGEGQ